MLLEVSKQCGLAWKGEQRLNCKGAVRKNRFSEKATPHTPTGSAYLIDDDDDDE